MAYLFGSATADIIDCGTPGRANTFTVFSRFSPAAASTEFRILTAFRESTEVIQMQLLFGGGIGVNQITGTIDIGGVAKSIFWDSGFGVGVIHTVVFTYDGHFLRLYADTDSTPKAISADLNGNPDQSLSQRFEIGNTAAAPTFSFHGTIYEIGWWPGTVLTGAQAAQLGAGNASGIPLPSNYWGLVSDASDLFGGQNGTVTGATLVPQAGTNLYSASVSVGGTGDRYYVGRQPSGAPIPLPIPTPIG